METEAGVEITLFQEEYRKWREKDSGKQRAEGVGTRGQTRLT